MRTKSLARARGERIDKDEAIARATEILGEGEHLRRVTGATGGKRQVRTVLDLVEAWLGHQVRRARSGKIRPATMVGYRAVAKRLSRFPIMAVRCADLQERHLERLLELLRAEYAAGTVAQSMMVMDAALRWGAKLGACPGITSEFRPDLVEAPMPTVEHVQATLQAMRSVGEGWPRARETGRAVELLFLTGARSGELARSRVEEVRLDLGIWRVRGGEGAKTGGRSVPLSHRAAALLEEQVAGRSEGPLWPPERDYRAIYNIWNGWIRRSAEEAGVPHWSCKGLRHLAVSRMLAGSIDVATVASITGHSPQTLLKVYAHVFERRRRDAMAILAQPVGQVIPMRRQK
jgi:integrase